MTTYALEIYRNSIRVKETDDKARDVNDIERIKRIIKKMESINETVKQPQSAIDLPKRNLGLVLATRRGRGGNSGGGFPGAGNFPSV